MYAKELDDLIVKKPDLTEKIYFSDIKSSLELIVQYQKELSKDIIVSKKKDNFFIIKNKKVGYFLGIDVEQETMILLLDIAPKGAMRYKGSWYISLVNGQPKLYIDVIDQENVSVSLKRKTLALTKDAINGLKCELEIKCLAKRKEEEVRFKNIRAPKKAESPEKTLPNPNKRKKIPEKIDLQEEFEIANKNEKLRYRLIFDEKIQNPDEQNPQRIKEAIDRYNNSGAGTIKILKVLHTQSGRRLISLRVGTFRALFEAPTDGSGKALLIRVLNRKDYRKFDNRNF